MSVTPVIGARITGDFDADGADLDGREAAHGRREIGWNALAGKFGLG